LRAAAESEPFHARDDVRVVIRRFRVRELSIVIQK
jgi:hypothetical protein